MWFPSPEGGCLLPVGLTVTSHKGHVLASGLLHLFWKPRIWRVWQGKRGTVPSLGELPIQHAFPRDHCPPPPGSTDSPCPKPGVLERLWREGISSPSPLCWPLYWRGFFFQWWKMPTGGRETCWYRPGKSFLFSSAACIPSIPRHSRRWLVRAV